MFQPHDDPDDHFDLATLFALREFEILGIIVEHGEKQASRPGQIPVRQMLQLTGRQVPCVVGLNPPLKSPSDPLLDQPAEYQQGVALILDKLRASDRKVTIFTTGSMRDVAAALNRDPDLMRQKVGRIYMNIGNAVPQDSEYNVDLDPHAYVRILESGLPVYWCPCFGAPYGTYWKFRQEDVLVTAPAGLQNFFLFALATGARMAGDAQTRGCRSAGLPDARYRSGNTACRFRSGPQHVVHGAVLPCRRPPDCGENTRAVGSCARRTSGGKSRKTV